MPMVRNFQIDPRTIHRHNSISLSGLHNTLTSTVDNMCQFSYLRPAFVYARALEKACNQIQVDQHLGRNVCLSDIRYLAVVHVINSLVPSFWSNSNVKRERVRVVFKCVSEVT